MKLDALFQVKFLLDINAVIAVLNDNRIVLDRLRQHAQNHARIDALRFAILYFGAEDVKQPGEVRAVLEQPGTQIGAYNVLIAVQALAWDLILVTPNTRKFKRVTGLRTRRRTGGSGTRRRRT